MREPRLNEVWGALKWLSFIGSEYDRTTKRGLIAAPKYTKEQIQVLKNLILISKTSKKLYDKACIRESYSDFLGEIETIVEKYWHSKMGKNQLREIKSDILNHLCEAWWWSIFLNEDFKTNLSRVEFIDLKRHQGKKKFSKYLVSIMFKKASLGTLEQVKNYKGSQYQKLIQTKRYYFLKSVLVHFFEVNDKGQKFFEITNRIY